MKRIIAVILLTSTFTGCANINQALNSDPREYDKRVSPGEQALPSPFILVRLTAGFAVGVSMPPIFAGALVYDGVETESRR